MLIHANRCWPQAIDAYLWPYAIWMVNDAFNSTPDLVPKLTPIEAFSGTNIAINPKHFYHFRCPVYILINAMQAGQKIDKWTEQVWVGIYLGTLLQHARMVALVPSLTTGLALPQFHVCMDSTFQTMWHSFGEQLPWSLWQEKCHFVQPTLDSEGGKQWAMLSGSMTSPMEIQADNEEPQLETNLPQESHLLSDPITEPGPEPTQQPQLTPDTANVPQWLIKIFKAEITNTNQHYVAYKVLAQPDDIKPELDYQHLQQSRHHVLAWGNAPTWPQTVLTLSKTRDQQPNPVMETGGSYQEMHSWGSNDFTCGMGNAMKTTY